jgi:hypothetical protein
MYYVFINVLNMYVDFYTNLLSSPCRKLAVTSTGSDIGVLMRKNSTWAQCSSSNGKLSKGRVATYGLDVSISLTSV